MTSRSKFPILMNSYNGAKYLKDLIDSVISQTYQNWKLFFYDKIHNNYLTTIEKKLLLNLKNKNYFKKSHIIFLYFNIKNLFFYYLKNYYLNLNLLFTLSILTPYSKNAMRKSLSKGLVL